VPRALNGIAFALLLIAIAMWNMAGGDLGGTWFTVVVFVVAGLTLWDKHIWRLVRRVMRRD
jgi:hypothetical protein